MGKKTLLAICFLFFLSSCESPSKNTLPENSKVKNLVVFAEELHNRFNITKETIPFFESALKLAPNNFKANGDLGTIFLKLNQPSDSLPFLIKAAEIKPYDIELNLNIGHAYFRTKQYKNSFIFFQRVVEIIHIRIQKFPSIPQFELTNLSRKLSTAYSLGGIAADLIGNSDDSILYTQKAEEEFKKLGDLINAGVARNFLKTLEVKYKKS
jgi:tetratricopeptide (TPR) repeat protein